MSTEVTVRSADPKDAPAINAIFNLFVVNSHTLFDVEPWTDPARVAWLEERIASGHTVLVAVRGDEILGAAWSGPWRTKAAYARSAETTVVIDPSVHDSGVGEHLYTALLSALAASGIHRCYAVIALPNVASIGLHRKLGFTEIGTLDEVGHKDGRYISTTLMELRVPDDG